jgi:small subunit ribosomal protein S15
MPYLTLEKKASIFAEFGGNATNTGSIEAQVALLTCTYFRNFQAFTS